MGDSPRFPFGKKSPYKRQSSYTPRSKASAFSPQQIIESTFSKKRNLKNLKKTCSLPPPHDVFKSDIWENKHMMNVKKELNDVKNRLSDFNMKDWHQHTRKTNLAGDVVNMVRKKISPELLTQAWCKFYEIVSTYNLIPEETISTNYLNSLHLCEAPGAFISSLNHFLKLQLPNVNWQWRASTLNPYFEGNKLSFMINDDRFILHSLDFWEFGRNQTGDMFLPENIDALTSITKLISPIHLVTADGSIDCQGDPGEQEAIVCPLHYCETLVALSVLSQGGSFLLKMFTMFECSTICLLYLLSCVFETVDFFKPATSKEGNSEVYVICLNFHGPAAVEPYMDLFRANFVKLNTMAMFSEDQIPLEFLCKISECSDYFKTHQVNVLKRNLKTYASESSNEDETRLFQIKRQIAYSFLERYRLEPLPLPDDYIVGNDIIRQTLTLNLDSKNEEWTFSKKKSQDSSNVINVLEGLKAQLNLMKSMWPQNCEPVYCFESDLLHKGLDLKIVPVFGTPVKTVYSSKFCVGSLLHAWNKLCEIKEVDLHNALQFEDVPKKLQVESEKLKICDMNQVEYGGNVCCFEKECLTRLVNILKDMNTNEDLLLMGFPLLTRVSVGIVFFIAQLFNKVNFVDPVIAGYAILFTKRSNIDLLPSLEDLLRRMSHEKVLALHSFVPITLLVKDPDWYRCILSTNHIHLKNVVLQMIQVVLSNTPADLHSM